MTQTQFTSIPEAVLYHAADDPHRLCAADAVCEMTYGEMAQTAGALAAYFASRGIRPGDRVVIECTQRAAYLAIECGVWMAGAVFVPLENGCGYEKMASIARLTCAKLLICAKEPAVRRANESPAEGKSVQRADETPAQPADEALPGSQTSPVPSAPCPVLTCAQLTEALRRFPRQPVCDLAAPCDPDAVCEILFSTGTTGREKGIVLTHRNEIANAENVACGNDLRQDNVELIPSPLNHSHGLRSVYANLLRGASLVLVDNVFDMKRLFAAIEKYAVTSIDLVPAALSMILSLSRDKLGDYRSQLRYIEFGSAPLRTADKEKLKRLLPQTAMNNFYGSTESGRSTVYNFNTPDEKPGCIGRPTKNAVILIVDEYRRPIESDARHTGLLASGGAMNMAGYFQDEAETAAAMENGILYTKDEAYFDGDGDIMLLGRADDVINVGGRKVSPEELEDIVRRMPEVADCACIGVDDRLSGKVPKVFVQMRDKAAFDAKAIKDFIRSQTEAYKVPKYVEQIDKIPRTYNGKLLRRALK